MVIPAAGGVIVLTLADLAIAIILFAAFAMIASQIAWMVVRSRSLLGGIPFVGGAMVNAINVVWSTTGDLVYSLEGLARQQLWWMHHQIRLVLNYFLWSTITSIFAQQAWWFGLVEYIIGVRIPTIEDGFNRVWALANTTAAMLDAVIHIRIESLEQGYNRVWALANLVAGRLDYVLHGRVEPLEGNYNKLRDLTSELTARYIELATYLPLLRTLAQFETQTVGGFARLGTRVAELERGEADLLRELNKVIPLSIITALGIAAVMNLERLARDPCHCLTLGDFSDLPARVDALESAGP